MKKFVLVEQFMDVLKSSKVIDMSYPLEEGVPVWPTHARFSKTIYESYDYGNESLQSALTLGEHTGTHLDAPKHFIKGGKGLDEIPITKVMGRGVKIDADFLEPNGVLTKEMIIEHEKKHGEIKEGDIVFLRYGWDEKYDIQPNTREFLQNWPGLGKCGAEYLFEKKVGVVGCDALSVDSFSASGSPAHSVLLSNDILIIENVHNLKFVPNLFFVLGLPLNVKAASGAPIRLIAFIDK